jgi:CRISPR-associated protein Cas2
MAESRRRGMMILLTYDVNTETVSGKKRLRKVAKICLNYGIRVQNSVFECSLDASQLVTFRAEILDVIDETKDSVRIYNLGNDYKKKVEHYGIKVTPNQEGSLIF